MTRKKQIKISFGMGTIIGLMMLFVMSDWAPFDIYMINPVHYVARHIRSSLHTLVRLGKTHFIIGYEDILPPEVTSCPPERVSHVTQCEGVYFSPDDHIRDILVQLIGQEKQQIRIAIFMLTDMVIAKALVNAHKKGVDVELLVDPGCLRDTYNKVSIVLDAGIPVYVYNAQSVGSNFGSLMHNKFALFAQNDQSNGAPLVATGSFNFTKSAHERNRENIVLLSNENIHKRYLDEYEYIKQQSYSYGAREK